MRILIAAGVFSPTARYDNAVFALAKELSGLADVCVLSISRFPFPRLRPQRTTFDVVEPHPTWGFLTRCIRNFSSAWRAVSRYTTPYSLYRFLGLVRYLANYSQIQLTLETYRPDVVHVHSSDLERSAYIDYLLSRRGTPFLLTVHGLYSLDPHISSQYDVASLEGHILRQLSDNGIHITFASSGLKEAAVQKFAIEDGKLTVIPNGVDIERFRPIPAPLKDEMRVKYGIPLRKKVLIQVGTIYRLKNHMFVLRCLESMDPLARRKLHYLIVGDGPQKQKLIGFCRVNKLLEFCTFAGPRYGSELVELYGASELLLLPSTSENFPLVILEAMAMGLPVLMFNDLWPVKDIANPDATILVSERTTESFNAALLTGLKRSWDASKIRATAEQFSWEVVAKRYYGLYSEIIAGRTPRNPAERNRTDKAARDNGSDRKHAMTGV